MKLVISILLGVVYLVNAQDPEEYIPFQGTRHDNFDWQLSKTIFQKERGNVVLSPFSTKVILLLLAEASGVDSDTYKQLQVIYPNIRVPYEGRDVNKKILTSLANSVGVTMKTGTRVLIQNGFRTRPRYEQILEKYYDTPIDSVDFSHSAETAQIINNWTANLTNNKIQNLVSPDELDNNILVLLNAVYFKGSWSRPFRAEKNVNENFQAQDRAVQTAFMTDTDNYYFFESTQLNAKILRLPYANSKFSMFIVLPKGNIDELIKSLDSKTVNREAWYLDKVEVKVKIPKFEFTSDTNLKAILQSLGIVDIFTDKASFPLFISSPQDKKDSGNLKVSNIKQKAGIKVDEQGSEAYAATIGQIVNKFGAEPAEFFATKPFVFFIEDESTGTVLFAGKVTDPTK